MNRSSGESVVDVDHLGVNAEGLVLGGEVLGVGRAAGVTDEHAVCTDETKPSQS